MYRTLRLTLIPLSLLCMVQLTVHDAAATATTSAPQAPQTLQQLLELVRNEQVQLQRQTEQREAAFIAKRDQQQARVDSLRIQIREREAQLQALRATELAQQRTLGATRQRLQVGKKNLSGILKNARSVSSELVSVFRTSMATAGRPERSLNTEALAQASTVPSFEQLRSMFHAMLDEMVHSSEVEVLTTPIIAASGLEEQAQWVRLGVFSAVSEGRFLRHIPRSGAHSDRLVALANQPSLDLQQLAKAVQQAAPGALVTAPLDPSRGAILATLVAAPSFSERIVRGGGIGYLILAVGILGLAIVLERGWFLQLAHRRMKAETNNQTPSNRNPLGRLLLAYAQYCGTSAESLVLRLEERVQKEVPLLQRRLSMLGVLAAIAPLLGLLGTVTGMIVTFQSISLHGAGDPKLMSGGISQALVTTELGLLVAVPLTLLHTMLSSRSRRLVEELDERSTQLIAQRVGSQDHAS